jgi:hypothetical protein
VIVAHCDYNNNKSAANRDKAYPRATLHSQSKLKDLRASRDIFLERLGLGLANFLVWFANTEKIPKISDDSKSGRFSLMAWSLGCCTPLALPSGKFLAYLAQLNVLRIPD